MSCNCNSINLSIFVKESNKLQQLFDNVSNLEQKIVTLNTAMGLMLEYKKETRTIADKFVYDVSHLPKNMTTVYNDYHLGFIDKLLRRGVYTQVPKTIPSYYNLYTVSLEYSNPIQALEEIVTEFVSLYELSEDNILALVDIYKRYDTLQQWLSHYKNVVGYKYPTVQDDTNEKYLKALHNLQIYKNYLNALEPVPVSELETVITNLETLQKLELPVLLDLTNNNFSYREDWDNKVPDLIKLYKVGTLKDEI